jgi:5'-3' exonuclease
MSGPLLAVDGPFILYRSFFALPKSIVGIDERPVNALLGATNLLLRVVADRSPRAVVVCFGAEAAAYRVEAYPPYHADRPPVPDILEWQFEAAPELFAAFGWSSESEPTLEADDVMNSFAQAETAAGGRSEILSGDRDMYQCASDDGLPGAPGIGAKTAADLLLRHGSLAAAIEHADGERPRVAASLRENGAQLLRFRDIATLRAVGVVRPADRATDPVGGAEAARRYGMRKLAERLGSGGAP